MQLPADWTPQAYLALTLAFALADAESVDVVSSDSRIGDFFVLPVDYEDEGVHVASNDSGDSNENRRRREIPGASTDDDPSPSRSAYLLIRGISYCEGS